MERKCQICSTEIGNEYHFLLHCPAIDDTARIDYFCMVNKYLPPIKDRDTAEEMINVIRNITYPREPTETLQLGLLIRTGLVKNKT